MTACISIPPLGGREVPRPRPQAPQVVILAAGTGSRLGPAGAGRPKCLVEVGGRPLLVHHLEVLRTLGLQEVCVIIGHLGDLVRRAVGASCECLENDLYSQTNSLVSLWTARRWVRGPLMVINGDVLAHRSVYAAVASAKGNALAYDSRSGTEDEHMKVVVRDGLVEAIGKGISRERSTGENVGMLKFDAEGAAQLMRQASALIAQGGLHLWAPAAVEAMLSQTKVRAIDVAGIPWTEIDYAEDLEQAEVKVWPAIIARDAQRPRRSPRRSPTRPTRRLRVDRASAASRGEALLSRPHVR